MCGHAKIYFIGEASPEAIIAERICNSLKLIFAHADMRRARFHRVIFFEMLRTASKCLCMCGRSTPVAEFNKF